ncbi:pyridoxine 5'-phosphate synthase [bacterium]|nr:pyridoxine 5'-phosphate synthase [bacterium]
MSAAGVGRRVLLGVNVDHVATLRQARGTTFPDPVEAARLALEAGADGITVHLREDRRHVQEHDVERLRSLPGCKLNLEMAATPAMVDFACAVAPDDVCIVPERRAELTTEGGLAVAGHEGVLSPLVGRLVASGVRVSLFIDPDPRQIEASRAVGAGVVELHTGRWCDASGATADAELAALRAGATAAASRGLVVNAGHGLTTTNVGPVALLPGMNELNIGHSIVARSVFVGIAGAVREMRRAIDRALEGA